MRKIMTVAAIAFVAAVAAPAAAKQCTPSANAFITLGTMGGPVPDKTRSQPANALIVDGAVYLVDAGDGTVGQLAKSGIALQQVKGIFLSHLHADHTGGLSAVLSLRNQTEQREKITVYGPPGTRELVTGIVASMQPAAKAGYGIPGQPWPKPEDSVSVVELSGDTDLNIGRMRFRSVQNTHYDFPPNSPEDQAFKSLSLRFDLPGRSIVYTGDTGPSSAVEQLAAGADLLVSEMIDVDMTLQRVAQSSPNMPEATKRNLIRHLTTHHLAPEDVGKLAARAGVHSLVVTHFVGGTSGPDRLAAILGEVKQQYKGPATLANDLDCF